MNFLTALLLLLMEEEAAFWCLAAIVEDILPGYFTNTMLAGAAYSHHSYITRASTLVCFNKQASTTNEKRGNFRIFPSSVEPYV